MWWSIRYDKVYHLTADGKIISVPVPEVEKLDNIFLDFSDSGRLYAIILGRETTGRQGAGFRSLYQLEDNGTWTMVADMLTDDHRVWWTMPVACKDGSVYAVASIGSDMISPERCDVSCDAVVRITQNGEMILIGYDFPYDCMAAACDPSTGDILFCHSSGVYRMEIPD